MTRKFGKYRRAPHVRIFCGREKVHAEAELEKWNVTSLAYKYDLFFNLDFKIISIFHFVHSN